MLRAHDDIYLPWSEPNEVALETLRIIRALLTEYPIEWQVKLVKILAIRTAIIAQEQLQTRHALSA
jgi:hypothetical protein